MTVTNKEQAWKEANRLFPTDYEKDEASSLRAGYDIYRHRKLNYYSRICDLGDRLEVLTGESGENVTNIWIVPEGCEFCRNFDFSRVSATTERYGDSVQANIYFAGGSTRFPVAQQFHFCPVCGRRAN